MGEVKSPPFLFVGIIMPMGHGTKTQVFSTTIALVEEERNDLADTVLLSVLQNVDISDIFLDKAIHGTMALHTERYYNYCRDYYYFGLPQGVTGGFDTVSSSVLKEVMEDSLGYEILLQNNVVEVLTVEHAALPHIFDNRGYNVDTNQISSPPASSVPPLESGETRTCFLRGISLAANNIDIVIQYIYYTDDGDAMTPLVEYIFQETIAMPALLVPGAIFCIATYTTPAAPAVLQWWYYNIESGVYPSVNISYDALQAEDVFMPIIPIRYKKRDLNNPASEGYDEDLHTTSVKALKYLGLNMDDLASNLNENPSIDDINHAYISHFVDPNNTKPEGIYYLGQLFHYISQSARFGYVEYIQELRQHHFRKENVFDFEDPSLYPETPLLTEEIRLRIGVHFSYITSRTVTGRLGNVGYGEHRIYTKTVLYDWDIAMGADVQVPVDDWFIEFKIQIAEHQYREVTVCNLVHRNNIHHGISVRTYLEDLLDSEEHNMVIPIHYGLVMTFPKKIRDTIMRQSLTLLINSEISTSIPWYGQGWFVVVKMIISFILTVIYPPAGLASFATMTVTQVILYILRLIFIMIALKVLFNYVAKILGPEWAGMMAVITAVISIVYAGMNGGFDLGNTTLGLTTAQLFMTASLGLFDAASSLLGQMLGDVQDDMLEFQEEAKRKQDELDIIEASLQGNAPLLDALDLLGEVSYNSISSDPPDNFYSRTADNTNPGVRVLNVVENFCDILTQPPDPIYNNYNSMYT